MSGEGSNGKTGKAGVAAVVGAVVLIGGWTVYSRTRANSTSTTFIDAPNKVTSQTVEIPNSTPPSPALKTDTNAPPATEPAPKPDAPPAVEDIVVHVTGAVKKPGVYHLPVGSRGEDALTQAGGVTKDANVDALNLAAKLEDGSQLYVPTRKEEPKALAQKEYEAGNAPVVVSATPEPSKPAHGAAKPAAHSAHSSGSSAKLTDPSQGMVNINKAGEEELQRLPGIGPAMAARVIAYRQESGGFQTPEDLMNVKGIAEKKFAKLKPLVKVK